MKLVVSIYVYIIFSCAVSYCQNTTNDDDILENTIEDTNADEFNFDTFQENLDNLKKHPIDINKATYSELNASGLLTDVQIRDLLQHIKYYGALVNLYELQTIPSFDVADIIRIQPYISLIEQVDYTHTPFFQELYKGDYQYYVRAQKIFEEQRGYSDDSTLTSPYIGNNLRIYTRIKYNYQNKISYGITAEKDPGEIMFGNYEPYGFDYYSAHFFMRGKKTIKALAIGDYQVSIGQGASMWTGFGYGKSTFPTTIRKTGSVLDPYTSVDENKFLRGAAVTLGKKNINVTVFGSYKSLDANISTTDSVTEDALSITSLNSGGLHRNENELLDKDAIKETIAGADITYTKQQFNIGIDGIYYHLNTPLIKDAKPYQYFDFQGNTLINTSLHYNYLWKNVLVFGETALSDNGKIGTVNGVIMPIDTKIDLAVLYRYFDKGYQAIYGSSFTDASLPQNETGIYMGFEMKPIHAWKVSGYIDIYKHPWLEYEIDAPSNGTDLLGQITYTPSKTFETYIRCKYEVSDHNVSSSLLDDPLPFHLITDLDKGNLRWNLDYDMSKSLTLRSRVELSFYDQNINMPEHGYIIYQDINYHPLGIKWGLNTRFEIFNTDSYNTRIYTYESDVLYAYSIIPLYGEGSRYYFTFSYSPFRWMDIWLRFSQTWYTNATETFGTGLDEITGNKKSEGKIQLRLKW